jgi:hypothetical protein
MMSPVFVGGSPDPAMATMARTIASLIFASPKMADVEA